MKHNRTRGFTLIEVIIALAVVALLASIALPSFRDQVVKSQRADAKTTMLGVMQQQEAFFTENNTYTLDLRDLGYPSQDWNDTREGLYQIRVMASNDACGLPECIRLYVRPRTSESQAGDIQYRLWSTGKKQHMVDGSWKNGWVDTCRSPDNCAAGRAPAATAGMLPKN